MLNLIPVQYRISAYAVAAASLIMAGFYTGYSWRQDEVDKGVLSLATCQTLTDVQNAAVQRLKSDGDAQTEKILKAQRDAEKYRQKPPVKREPPPDECGAAMVWGQSRAKELSAGWK